MQHNGGGKAAEGRGWRRLAEAGARCPPDSQAGAPSTLSFISWKMVLSFSSLEAGVGSGSGGWHGAHDRRVQPPGRPAGSPEPGEPWLLGESMGDGSWEGPRRPCGRPG